MPTLDFSAMTPLALSLVPLQKLAAEFWFVLSVMAPYLLFGFLVAGVLSVVISAEVVERHLGGRGLWPVAKAALLGVPLPLCSCGVIPVAASLRRHGASRGATSAFLLSTPQTGVDSVFVTLSLLGPVFAVFRPLAALFTGLLGGTLVMLFGHDGTEPGAEGEACQDACCTGEGGGKLRRIATYGFVTLPRDIGRPLLVGLVVAGLIAVVVPQAWFEGGVGTGFGAMLAMMALGIPIYVCSTASVPIAAALMLKGLSPGAALVFLMAGPATNAAAVATVWKVLGKRACIINLATVAVSSLGCGLLLNALVAAVSPTGAAATHAMLPPAVRTASAVVLLAVLAAALLPRRRQTEAGHDHEAEEPATVLRITGMSCGHCVATVRRALLECAGVAAVDVSLEAGSARVSGEGLDGSALRGAVEALGYSVADAPDAPPLSAT